MFYSTAHPPLHTYCGGVVMVMMRLSSDELLQYS